MTDSEKIAAPAEQPVASEKPMSAAADAVETPSEPAPEKKPRRPRRKKPAVEQATLELSARERRRRNLWRNSPCRPCPRPRPRTETPRAEAVRGENSLETVRAAETAC
ncbi:MAG: hypothetical protein ACLT2T_07625 [Bilophila wadsworthia]